MFFLAEPARKRKEKRRRAHLRRRKEEEELEAKRRSEKQELMLHLDGEENKLAELIINSLHSWTWPDACLHTHYQCKHGLRLSRCLSSSTFLFPSTRAGRERAAEPITPGAGGRKAEGQSSGQIRKGWRGSLPPAPLGYVTTLKHGTLPPPCSFFGTQRTISIHLTHC